MSAGIPGATNLVDAKVLRTRMMMDVLLPTGQIVLVPGNAPKDSSIKLKCSDITPKGKVLGYEGYVIVHTPTTLALMSSTPELTLEQKADALGRPHRPRVTA